MSDFNTAKETFLAGLASNDFMFATTLAFIDTWYDYTPTAFCNGDVQNQADQNQGSAKVFGLSQLLELTKEQTLQCFGEHYRDVLATPEVNNHHNLRRVLREGIGNITFDQFPLAPKV
ncbi:HopJ type III effector protein [Halioxenophilus sp. WMMB6]|uniref:HopJ type III effector protein n=1 Tax=Halioxenophilus sp. WMMB6 TaxID=3073815 RepID=UPI00295E7C3B|nr:HopJ type III effector protein [Halioxenophilus sp. WMMB6]